VRLLPTNILPQRSWRLFFGVTSKKGLQMFFYKRCAPFFEETNVGRHFCWDFQWFCPNFQEFCLDFQGFSPDFQGFCLNFQRFCTDFWQIKLLGVCLNPLHSHLPHHCLWPRQFTRAWHSFFPDPLLHKQALQFIKGIANLAWVASELSNP